jgi:chromosomal replication initiation ATPase DnaA
MTSGSGRQLILDFPRLDPAERPLIETAPYREPLAALRRWRDWPEGQLAITGEPFSGRTRLLTLWAADAGAALVTGKALASADITHINDLAFGALAVDDADAAADGLGLLAALNLCRERRATVLLAGRAEPGTWFSSPPDLKSRLVSMPVTAIGRPDDETLELRLQEECVRRHLILPAESVRYLAQRMTRSWAALGEVADMVEATPGRAETRPSARKVLLALGIDPG